METKKSPETASELWTFCRGSNLFTPQKSQENRPPLPEKAKAQSQNTKSSAEGSYSIHHSAAKSFVYTL